MKIQIKSILDKVLFEHKSDNNSIKKTLIEAIEQGANLWGANLLGANLQGADLWGADLRRADLPNFTILPQGDLIGYKKLSDNQICKLLIPQKAKRVSSLIGRKCRAEYAKVLQIKNGRKRPKQAVGIYDKNLIYKVGEILKADSFDDDIRIECSHGIHFFITEKEAKEYQQ